MRRKTRYSASQWVAALPSFLGGKRNLAPTICHHIRDTGYGPQRHRRLIDPFAGGLATSLHFKLASYEVHCNDQSYLSYVAGKALIENKRQFGSVDLKRLMAYEQHQMGLAYTLYTPRNFTDPHGKMLDRLIQFAHHQKDEALKHLTLLIAWRYMALMCPLTHFSGENSFNRAYEEGRFDDIKDTYRPYLKRVSAAPMTVLMEVLHAVNGGIIPTPYRGSSHQGDAVEFILSQPPSIVYLDPPTPNARSHEADYGILAQILQNEEVYVSDSPYSSEDGWQHIENLILACENHPCVCITLGNAGGKNQMTQLTDLILKHRPRDRHRFVNLTDKHERIKISKSRKEDWLCLSWRE